MHMMHQGYGQHSLWSMFFMNVIWIAIIGLVIYAIVRLVQGRRQSSPIDILNERLAKGEIDIDEYEKMKEKITERRK